eukprot:6101083-Amphidinium_carterae.1
MRRRAYAKEESQTRSELAELVSEAYDKELRSAGLRWVEQPTGFIDMPDEQLPDNRESTVEGAPLGEACSGSIPRSTRTPLQATRTSKTIANLLSPARLKESHQPNSQLPLYP